MSQVFINIPPTITGTITTVTASGVLASSGGNTPNITLAGIIPIINGGTGSSTQNFLSNTDTLYSLSNTSDSTKIQKYDLSGQSTGVTTTISPLATQNQVYNIQPNVDSTANIITQNTTSGQIFIGANTSLGGANSGIQYSNATTANRGQIRLGSYVNVTSVAGVTTATSRSGTVGVNAAVVAGQDYSKWTAQAGATTPGSLPISGSFAFKANTVNSLTVTSDFHIQLANLAGVLGDRFYLSSEGLLKLPGYGAGTAIFDASGNITSVASSTILAFTSNPSSGGAVSEALTVPGLLTTDTILSVTQMTQGGATRTSLPLIGWNTVVTNGLTAQWVADPGVGAVLLVAVKR